ncbi:MAG: DUF262 domain-containing protein [Ramlibacter sp.]
MEANPRTITKLFNSQMRYVVPMFQRKYVWSRSPQWETLWEDIVEKANQRASGDDPRPHYLGALIIEGVKPTSPGEVMRFLVVDGQQRLTTLQILICALRDIARANEWKNLDKTLSRYLENADPDVMDNPEEEVLKLWPTTLNRDVFKSIVQAGSRAVVETKHPIITPKGKRKPLPRSNLVEAYLYFSGEARAWIDRASNEKGLTKDAAAQALVQSVQNDFCVVEISLSEGDDTQEIFYSLNSQGQPLSQSDLLRSLVFMRAEKEKQNRDEIFDKYWGHFETDFWSFETKRGGRTYSRLDLGLRFFLMAKTGQMVDARRVNEEYRRWITAKPPKYPSVREELADFKRHGDAYAKYEAPPPLPLPCTDLRRVVRDFEVSTALPLIMHLELEAGLDDAQRASCLAVVESFLARRIFTGEENKEYNKFFVEVIGSILSVKGDAVLPALRKKLLDGGGSTRTWPTNDEVVAKAITREVFEVMPKAALRLVLERLELWLRTKKSESVEITPSLQVEHVMPQRWWTHWPIEGKTVPESVARFYHLAMANPEFAALAPAIRQRNSALHTLGNLTLLNQYLNPAAGNAPFSVKLDEYRASVLQLNRYFAEFKTWDDEAIAERSKLLGEAICSIWPR